MPSLTLEQARALLWDAFEPGPAVWLPWDEAQSLVLAQDLVADRPFPPFHRMAMDGYAVRAADTQGAAADSPVRLRVVGTAAAGAPLAREVREGEAAKAMTGAPLPAGADAVVKVESTAGWSDTRAVLHAAVRPGDNVAACGEDLAAGETIVSAGTCLGPRHVQAILSAGHLRLPVVAPPRTVVLATGDELVPATTRPGPAQIRESNSGCVAAVLGGFGVPCTLGGVVPDTREALRARLSELLPSHDLLVVSGGVSMGEKDHVKPVLKELGVEFLFESLHLRPGHPAAFGRHAHGAVFALPGNPVAVFATLVAVFAAGLRRRLGYPTRDPGPCYGTLTFPARRRGPRPQLLPVALAPGGPGLLPRVSPVGHHGSGDFVSLARADAFAFLPQDEHPTGSAVALLPTDPGAWRT